jgi:hypothetical protein
VDATGGSSALAEGNKCLALIEQGPSKGRMLIADQEVIPVPVLILMGCLLTAAPDRPDLTGRVANAAGAPVCDACVFIYTAGARMGVNPFCPSCYADCAKSATTNADGTFLIRSLDPSLIFRVLVVGEGCEPTFVNNVDPLRGPIEAVLRPVDSKRLAAQHFIRGRVVDDQGNPVVGAEVSPQTFKTKAFWGFSPGIFDPVSVTNANGDFLLTSRSPIDYVDVKIVARGCAGRIVAGLVPGNAESRLELGRGVSVTGRTVRQGTPLQGVLVGLYQVDRSTGGGSSRTHYVGHSEIATNETGRFLFSNVSPNDDLVVYGLMESVKPYGAIPVRRLRTGDHGTTLDVGDLPVQEGHRLMGRIALDDGKPVPAHTRVLVSREQAWDSLMVELDENGRFEVSGIPTEPISVSTLIEGYALSPRNSCATPFNPGLLQGLVDRDVGALTVLYEKGNQKTLYPTDRDSTEFYKKYADFKARAKRGIAGLLPEGVPQIESDYGPEGARRTVQTFTSALASGKLDDAARLCDLEQVDERKLARLAESITGGSINVASIDLSHFTALVLLDMVRRSPDGEGANVAEREQLLVLAKWEDEGWLVKSALLLRADFAAKYRERLLIPFPTTKPMR